MVLREAPEGLGQPQLLQGRRLGRDHAEDAVGAAVLEVAVGPEAPRAGDGEGEIELQVLLEERPLLFAEHPVDQLPGRLRVDRLRSVVELAVEAQLERRSAVDVQVARPELVRAAQQVFESHAGGVAQKLFRAALGRAHLRRRGLGLDLLDGGLLEVESHLLHHRRCRLVRRRQWLGWRFRHRRRPGVLGARRGGERLGLRKLQCRCRLVRKFGLFVDRERHGGCRRRRALLLRRRGGRLGQHVGREADRGGAHGRSWGRGWRRRFGLRRRVLLAAQVFRPGAQELGQDFGGNVALLHQELAEVLAGLGGAPQSNRLLSLLLGEDLVMDGEAPQENFQILIRHRRCPLEEAQRTGSPGDGQPVEGAQPSM